MQRQFEEVILRGIEEGLHPGAQVYASIAGKTVIDAAYGTARAPEGTAMGNDTILLWLSAGKPVTAIAIAILLERGKLQLDDAVAKHIPEFAQNGKSAVTIRHLLTHTAGFRQLDTQFPFLTWEETIAKLCAAGLDRDWVPGEKAGYSAHSGWYMLGEIIRRMDGRRCEAFLREEIFLPLEMKDTRLTLTAEEYAGYGERLGWMHEMTGAEGVRAAANLDTELACSRSRPSGGVRGPVRELGKFYEFLLGVRGEGPGASAPLVSAKTVRLFTSRQRVGMFDQSFRQKIDWGLGFIINSAEYGPGIPYQFGPHASRETFGHGGNQSSVGMCDPEKKLVVAAVFNGWPGEAAHDRRLRGFLRALYEDLELS